jgi:GntR family transcriptional repressor for pyruvate dehydrogenase complex
VARSLSPAKRGVKNEAADLDLAGLEPIKRTRIPDEIANRLRAMIVDGSFTKEEPLPSERVMAKRLRVSRSSVRDAIRRLEVIGLLETRHGQGTFLHELSVDNVVTPMASVLTFNRARQGDLMDARRAFEPAVARMAATRATDEELDAIDRILEEQRRKVKASEPTIGEDTAFHAALAQATHNPVIVGVMETLNDLLVESRQRSLERRGRSLQSLRGHEAVAEALRRHDADGAALAMDSHIAQIARLLGQDVEQTKRKGM